MSGTSSVGQSSVYEAGDQRNPHKSEQEEAERFKEGKQNSHLANDSKDERTIANKLAREEKREKEESDESKSGYGEGLEAKKHGNEPSKGAKIDQQLKEEEEAELKRKGKA